MFNPLNKTTDGKENNSKTESSPKQAEKSNENRKGRLQKESTEKVDDLCKTSMEESLKKATSCADYNR